MNAETVGERLRRLRLERGLSQRDLSVPGVSYAYISRIEAGTRTPSTKALRRLSGALSVSPLYLETGVEAVEIVVPTAKLDRRARKFSKEIPRWAHLTSAERAQVLSGLEDALLRELVARLHAVSINRQAAKPEAA